MVENGSKSFEHSAPAERPTDLRFNLSHPFAASVDVIVPGRIKERFVRYPTPEPEQIEIRSRLMQQGLILGKLVAEYKGYEQFKIPLSARPLTYDVQSYGKGAYTYTDDRLFSDLGQLLAQLSEATEDRLVIGGEIGRAVALIEFAHAGERQLFLIPGIEHLMKPLTYLDCPFDYYADCLGAEFSKRFINATTCFQIGYQAVANGLGESNAGQ